MVDNFSILLSHILIALAFWRLSSREDLDHEPPPAPDEEPEGFIKRKKPMMAKGAAPHA
jgi:hypothetical protein